MAEIGQDIKKAAAILSAGGLVGIPTETVYGLAANALNQTAIARVFEAKNRPSFDPLITHIANKEDLDVLAIDITDSAAQLINIFWPGPLTIVLKKTPQLSDLVSSGLTTAAFRMPRHPLLHELLTAISFPLVAPSANPFGYVSPTSAQHVQDQLGSKIDYILDGGPTKIGLESTIINMSDQQPEILRLGGLAIEDIEEVIGPIASIKTSSSKPSAPGMLSSHYSPSIPVVIGELDKLIEYHKDDEKGILSFTKNYPSYTNFVLSKDGNITEAATRLFKGLRWFESQDVTVILTEPVPDQGLGKAINDRLRRASYK